MITQILNGTVFHRAVDNKSAVVMGIVELSSAAPTTENTLYPMSLQSQLFSEMGALNMAEIDVHTNPDTVDIDTNLTRPIWPHDEKALSEKEGQWFYAVVRPLEGFKNHLFFYAAVQTNLFDRSGDSWLQLRRTSGRWKPRQPLCVSSGLNMYSLTQQTLWPIGDNLYKVDTNPASMRNLIQYLREFYIGHFNAGFSIDHGARVKVRTAAINAGYDESLVDNLLTSLHTMHADPQYMRALALANEIHPIKQRGRIIDAQEAQARAASMHQAIQQINNPN